MSSVAVLFGNKYFLSLKRAQYIEFQSVSLNIFRNIESLAKDKIDKELRFNKEKLTKNNPLISEPMAFNLNGAEIIGKITDSGNCFNINSIVTLKDGKYVENKKTTSAFRKILSLNEIDNNIIEEVIDQTIDWIDKDANPRAFGLEDYYYSGPLHSPREYTIHNNASENEIADHVFKDNQSIDQASIDLIVNGITSCEEIIRVNNIKEDASL